MKPVIEKGKKPRGFLEFQFLATHRDQCGAFSCPRASTGNEVQLVGDDESQPSADAVRILQPSNKRRDKTQGQGTAPKRMKPGENSRRSKLIVKFPPPAAIHLGPFPVSRPEKDHAMTYFLPRS
eukprot:CAMPEP_0116545578 /NCGR_PEP_ID=MMETSP0397-20121206/2747_1 /TAXON_ID=216820 /ORGANISM="Cyclophora tenuis, Strain ECT3854" /LENGTH=123 /DNA_ID=CAMNT_0004069909 /DNA_START=59 /DNA_END=430 /DNA_ORIENTATION=-